MLSQLTDLDKVRQSACIIVNEDVKVEGEIGKMIIPGGKYIVEHFKIGMAGFEKAWYTMCNWFTKSGYQQGDGSFYKLYHVIIPLIPKKAYRGYLYSD